MQTSQAVKSYIEYHRSQSKKNTVRNYLFMMNRFEAFFGNRPLSSISPDDLMQFLNLATNGCKRSTRRLRFANIKSFYNFIKDTIDPALPNPCENAVLKKVFKEAKPDPWVILEKDAVDEVIFRTTDTRNRLMLELMARGGLRINEVLKLRPADVQDRKLILKTPKSGKDAEVAFIPAKVADRLAEYVRQQGIGLDSRIFAISYTSARLMVARAGNLVGIAIKPHDLRRFAATFASRSGTPIEIVSKIILRHPNLSTTQRYLGKVSDTEALRWIDQLHG